jgi:hypothetical protein
MESTNDGALDQTTLGILFRCVKRGLPLTGVCQYLQLEMPTVLRALSEKTSISTKTLKIALRMREYGKSLQDISDLCEVPMASLLEILPGDETEAKSLSSQAQARHSKEVGQVSEVEAVDISSTEPATHKLPRKRRAPSPDSTTTSKRSKQANKIGTRTWPNGASYEGELLNWEPHGYGAMRYADGGTYIGDWLNGLKEGRGVVSWPWGDRYEGGLKNGELNGHGAVQYADGGTYIGAWVSGKKEGRGVESWPNGNRYKGEFVNNLRHGYGTFMYDDGEVYTGSFQRDNKHGSGVLVMADGGRYTGTWSDSRKNGRFLYEKGGTSKTEVWVEGTLEEQWCLLA